MPIALFAAAILLVTGSAPNQDVPTAKPTPSPAPSANPCARDARGVMTLGQFNACAEAEAGEEIDPAAVTRAVIDMGIPKARCVRSNQLYTADKKYAGCVSR